MSGYWTCVDAKARGFKNMGIIYLLAAIPYIGPNIYLFIRPKAVSSKKIN